MADTIQLTKPAQQVLKRLLADPPESGIPDLSRPQSIERARLPLWCKLEKDGGDAGSSTTPCTFTYKVMLLDGTVLQEDVRPRRPRPLIGKHMTQEQVIAQLVADEIIPESIDAIGQVFIDKDGTLQLWDAGEVLDLRPCGGEAPPQMSLAARLLALLPGAKK